MLALTLHPEWAWAICHLGKRVENRAWRPRGLRPGDRLAIHAGKHIGGRPSAAAREDGVDAVLQMAARAGRDAFERAVVPEILASPTSAIVCTAVVTGWDRDQRTGWDVPGQWHWRLDDVVVLPEPVPCRGAQGLWRVPDDLPRLEAS